MIPPFRPFPAPEGSQPDERANTANGANKANKADKAVRVKGAAGRMAASRGHGVPAAEMRLRLDWPGRAWTPGDSGANGSEEETFPSIAPVEIFRASGARDFRCKSETEASPICGRLVHGDALDVARALAAEGLKGKVDLVYVDPPFASQAAYVHEARLDGPADGRVVRTPAYDDRWDRDGVGSYLDMLAPRLEALSALLAPTGTIWVHVDWRASYLVRLLLDEVMGRDAFVNEIVWRRAPNLGRQAASHQFGRTLDTLVVYGRERARLEPPTRLEPIDPGAVRWDAEGRPFTTAPRGDYTDASIARLASEGRVHRTASGRVYVKYFLVTNADGSHCRERRVDALWSDVPPLRHSPSGERTGYPTQKPRGLLDRIIACASPVGGVVVDLFAGSATTAESAHALGRRFVVGDAALLAIATARARLLRAGADLTVERCASRRSVDEPVEDSHPPLRVSVESIGERVRVELASPAEPLAWAIDPSYEEGHPFCSAWHSVRTIGSRVCPVERQAMIARGGCLAVRVWHEDGGVQTRTVPP